MVLEYAGAAGDLGVNEFLGSYHSNRHGVSLGQEQSLIESSIS